MWRLQENEVLERRDKNYKNIYVFIIVFIFFSTPKLCGAFGTWSTSGFIIVTRRYRPLYIRIKSIFRAKGTDPLAQIYDYTRVCLVKFYNQDERLKSRVCDKLLFS